jgi:hypothetical protein
MVYVNINEKRPTWTCICSEKKQFEEKDINSRYPSLQSWAGVLNEAIGASYG